MPEGGEGVGGEVGPFGLDEWRGVGGKGAGEGDVGVGGVGRAVSGVVGGDVLGVARLEIQFFEEALGGENDLAVGGSGELEGVEFGGERGGIREGMRKEIRGGLNEHGVPCVEVGAEGGIERGEGSEFLAQVVAEGAEL